MNAIDTIHTLRTREDLLRTVERVERAQCDLGIPADFTTAARDTFLAFLPSQMSTMGRDIAIAFWSFSIDAGREEGMAMLREEKRG